MNDDITSGGQDDPSQLNGASPSTAVDPATDKTLSLDEINALLGKNFPNKEAALKSWQDTNSYVGRKTEDIKKEVLAEVQNSQKTDILAKELEEMRKERFYDKNPQYSDINTRTLIEKIGGSPSDVVSSPEFKAVFDKVQGFDETQKLKTVLDSNPRLASSRDGLKQAAELKRGGASNDQISSLVVNAVKDAYNL